MVDITNIHVHYTNFKGKKFVKKIKPTDATNKLAIKHDIGEFIKKLQGKAEMYYVVVEIDQDGTPAYRTVIPKTLVAR